MKKKYKKYKKKKRAHKINEYHGWEFHEWKLSVKFMRFFSYYFSLFFFVAFLFLQIFAFCLLFVQIKQFFFLFSFLIFFRHIALQLNGYEEKKREKNFYFLYLSRIRFCLFFIFSCFTLCMSSFHYFRTHDDIIWLNGWKNQHADKIYWHFFYFYVHLYGKNVGRKKKIWGICICSNGRIHFKTDVTLFRCVPKAIQFSWRKIRSVNTLIIYFYYFATNWILS